MPTADARILQQARAYLDADDDLQRAALRPALEDFDGDLEAVAAALRPATAAEPERGWLLSQPFRGPRLAGRHPDQPLTLFVPPDYDPAQPRGLLIFLHGGGQGRGDHGRHLYDHNPWLNALAEESGRIVCYPSAPPHDRCWSRWQLPEADAYLEDVIEELESLYRLDPHDRILGGHSMGGMGAYHMAHRFADRFASVLASAGHWDLACWRALLGTTLWINHGQNDAILFRRRHGTDVAFARLARQRCAEAGVDCVYREHSGCHHMGDALWVLREWLDWSRDRRRDPCFPHVVAVTPRGLGAWTDWRRHKVPLAAFENHTDFHSVAPAPHARWVTIEGVGPETILFDMAVMRDCRDEVEDDWNDFSLALKRKHVPGGIVEARLREDRAIEVMPRNVTALTLWLHPAMVDLGDVRVVVRGQERFHGAVRPCLATLLDSYRRRRDWGLLYPARITIADDGTWQHKDQLKIQPR